jgi:hypothetical protein
MFDVDWSSVVPALITGAVGIAGVAGTLLSARIAANSSAERDRLAEKRRVYADFYRATSNMNAPVQELNAAIRSLPERRPELWKRLRPFAFDKAYEMMDRAFAEFRLIATDEIGLPAANIMNLCTSVRHAYRYAIETLRSTTIESNVGLDMQLSRPESSDSRSMDEMKFFMTMDGAKIFTRNMVDLLNKLTVAMRKDLEVED